MNETVENTAETFFRHDWVAVRALSRRKIISLVSFAPKLIDRLVAPAGVAELEQND